MTEPVATDENIVTTICNLHCYGLGVCGDISGKIVSLLMSLKMRLKKPKKMVMLGIFGSVWNITWSKWKEEQPR